MQKQLGRYELRRVIGTGAMGLVYEGVDTVLGRRVAVRTILLSAADDLQAYEARFRREALAAARMLHPNIVPVHDFGREGDIAYLVMAFVDGQALKALLDSGEHFSVAAVAALVLDLLAALDHAHENGVVHRDVKPATIMLEKGRAKLTDFGLAQVGSHPDDTPLPLGSPKYMSPEQARRQAPDHRTDLWSAGVVLYQLLCGRPPFDGSSVSELLRAVVVDSPAAPSSLRPDLPPAFDALLAKALAKDPGDRFQSAREFALALKDASRRPAAPLAEPAPMRAPAPASTSPVPTQSLVSLELELEFWKDIKDSGDESPFEDFLREFPDGKFAHLARRRLAMLRGGSTPASQPLHILRTGPSTEAARARGQDVPGRAPEVAPDLGSEGGPELPQGATVRDLLVRQHLSSGGFGIVYKAHDPGLDIEVALKEYLPRSLAQRDRAGQVRPFRDAQSQELFRKGLDSFLNEGRLLARLDHPGLAKVHQAFQANGTGYLVMKLYRGLTLKETLRRDPSIVTQEWLQGLLGRVGGALELLHGQAIYHRDIAPDNIILHEGREPVVLDFGAARRVLAQQDHTLTAIYKPGFAPVEQYGDDDALRQGAWTDIYALCATVHYAIHGRPPVAAPMRVRMDPQVPLCATAADRFSPRFLAAIDQGLSVLPAERPQSIGELLAAAGV